MKKRSEAYQRWIVDRQAKRDLEAEIPSENKVKCLLCNRWYRSLCRHVNQRHGVSAKEYKKEFGLPVKKGVIPEDLRKHYRKFALKNRNGLKNLVKYRRS